MLDGLNAGSVPGIVIATLALLGVVYQARVGVRPAERDGFRQDFKDLVKELREENHDLREHVEALEAKVEELTLESRALGRHARRLIRALEDNSIPVPTYVPPPDLSKHLN